MFRAARGGGGLNNPNLARTATSEWAICAHLARTAPWVPGRPGVSWYRRGAAFFDVRRALRAAAPFCATARLATARRLGLPTVRGRPGEPGEVIGLSERPASLADPIAGHARPRLNAQRRGYPYHQRNTI